MSPMRAVPLLALLIASPFAARAKMPLASVRASSSLKAG